MILKPRGHMREWLPVSQLSASQPLARLAIQSANSLIISTQLILQSFSPLPGHLRRICTRRLPHGLSQVLPYLSLTHTARSALSLSLTHRQVPPYACPDVYVLRLLQAKLLLITLRIPENVVFWGTQMTRMTRIFLAIEGRLIRR